MELKLAAELKSPKYVETIEVSKHHCISTRIKTSCAELLCCLKNVFCISSYPLASKHQTKLNFNILIPDTSVIPCTRQRHIL